MMPPDPYHEGSEFYLTINICNTDSTTYYDVPVFVILEAYGAYYFGPTWGTDLAYYVEDIPPDVTEFVIFEPFNWPPGAGSGQASFISAMTNEQTTELFGQYDIRYFSWN